ncbi:MAG: hypothetical protein ACK55Z_26890, partial [bacterium]
MFPLYLPQFLTFPPPSSGSPMASNRSLFCLAALLAICFVASGSAAVVDSGSNGSCQLVLQHTP